MDEAPANAVEAIVKDAVAGQRATGVIPRPNDVHKYVQGVVERMERRDEDERLRIKPKAAPVPREVVRSSGEFEKEYRTRLQRRGLEPLEGSWTVTRTPVPERSRVELTSQRTALAKRRMRARLRLLRSKPDWSDRLKAINPLALNGQLGPEKQKHAEFLVTEVIRASEAVFGPWWKAPPKKLIFT